MSYDKELGQKVHQHLLSLGIETPMTDLVHKDSDQKIKEIEPLIAEFMKILGMDLSDDSLAETPRRVAKMYVNELCAGLNYDHFPKCTTVENKMASKDEFVCVTDIKLVSICEHHLLMFAGTKPGYAGATVAYFPNDKVLGISKINRLVNFACQKPQIQERLGVQIAESLKCILETEDVAVYIQSQHTCSSIRGIKDTSSSTVTASLHGRFLHDENVRKEFLQIAKS